MDQDVAAALADIRHRLGLLQSALNVQSPDEAEAEVSSLKATVGALVEWAVAQGFVPPS